MLDHAGFQRFVSALQPLFKIGTRNTIRYILAHLCNICVPLSSVKCICDGLIIFHISERIFCCNMKWRGRKPLSTWLELILG
jgi:hypothetical protein